MYMIYEQKGDLIKANEIAKLNNAYLDIWREIPEKDEEEIEE